MSQVAFPGIFPDLTRYQAEANQTQVNAGHDPWKNDPTIVAKALEAQFFGWQRTVTTKLLSGGGPHDVYATVQVQEAPVQGALPSIVVTLSRLEGNTHNFWVAIGVADGTTLTLKNIEPRQLLTSPVTLEGTGAAFEALIGQAVVYDHLYTDIGHAQIIGSNGMGEGTYTTNVSYTTSFYGVQEGFVTVYENNGGLSAENSTAVMMKVLLNPEPGVTLGPLACPASVKDPSYWTPFVTHLISPPASSPAIRDAYSVSCGHLIGHPTLQVMVVATDILGGGPVYRSIFVFDKITDPQPKLLFKVEHLLHGEAQISGYSTIMTGEVDVNSSINKGKLEARLTTDLFREFKWSDGAGTFVQVAFPGIFPDLTRWQAEVDQLAVNQRQDNPLDAMQTTKNLITALLGGSNKTSATKLVSGGGAHDLTAVVNVTFPPGGNASIPVTQVTLSRLEGNFNGIWEVTAVATNWLFIYTPKTATTMSSPVTVTGFGPQFEAVIGAVYILDHLYQKIQVGDNFAMAPDGTSPPSKFSLEVKYTSSFQDGAQEGIVELVHAGGPSFDYGVVLVKVLISA